MDANESGKVLEILQEPLAQSSSRLSRRAMACGLEGGAVECSFISKSRVRGSTRLPFVHAGRSWGMVAKQNGK